MRTQKPLFFKSILSPKLRLRPLNSSRNVHRSLELCIELESCFFTMQPLERCLCQQRHYNLRFMLFTRSTWTFDGFKVLCIVALVIIFRRPSIILEASCSKPSIHQSQFMSRLFLFRLTLIRLKLSS